MVYKKGQLVKLRFRNDVVKCTFLRYSGEDSRYCEVEPIDLALLNYIKAKFGRFHLVYPIDSIYLIPMGDNNPNIAFKIENRKRIGGRTM